MIIRKPYAFLIKHFRKIHIILLVISAFVYYKVLQLNSFINEFMQLGTYDILNEPISQFVSFFAIVAMLVIIVGSLALILLLRHKQKPWKLYIVPVLEYIFMLIIFFSTKNYFDSYKGIVDLQGIRAIRDFLFIGSIVQFPVMAIFLIRILGVDLKKFNFKLDEEFLAMSNEDREELEINIDFDKDSVKRGVKRLLRNISYFYFEHRFIVNIVLCVLSVVLVYNSYKFIFVTNKAYRQGDTLNANGYTISINKSYYTDKDYRGQKISEDSSFVIIDMTIKNNRERRKVDFDQFHVMNGISNYTTTFKTYGTEFQDYGKTYEAIELRKDQSINFIMVFKVSKRSLASWFALYYQEMDGQKPHLRKIKLKIENVSKIKEKPTINIGEEMTFTLKNKKEEIIFEDYEILERTQYAYRTCTSSDCLNHIEVYEAPENHRILKIPFASNNFEGKDMIDFSTQYGKIKYINKDNKERSLNIKNPFGKTYYGKYLYVNVPTEVANSSKIEIEYIIRNNKYTYKLR